MKSNRLSQLGILFLAVSAAGIGRAHADSPFVTQVEACQAKLEAGQKCDTNRGAHRRFSWILVDGLLGDALITNLDTLARNLSAESPASTVQILHPSSFTTLDENVQYLENVLRLEMRKSRSPIIIVAHSRGGLETLVTLLKHPDWVASKKIQAAILVQGAIQGSPLASDALRTVDRLGSVHLPSIFGTVQRETLELLRMLQNTGMGLEPNQARARLRPMLQALSPQDRQNLNSHIFYVRSHATIAQMSTFLKPVGVWFGFTQGWDYETDGVVPTASQKLKTLGQDLGVLTGDHMSLLINPDSKNVKACALQGAFLGALLNQVDSLVP